MLRCGCARVLSVARTLFGELSGNELGLLGRRGHFALLHAHAVRSHQILLTTTNRPTHTAHVSPSQTRGCVCLGNANLGLVLVQVQEAFGLAVQSDARTLRDKKSRTHVRHDEGAASRGRRADTRVVGFLVNGEREADSADRPIAMLALAVVNDAVRDTFIAVAAARRAELDTPARATHEMR